MLRQAFEQKHGLGGDITLVLTLRDGQDEAQIFAELWRQIFTFERQFSRFLPESELSQFNRKAGLRVQITPEFSKLLQAAQKLSKQTEGLYNPFILPALQRAGYRRSALPGYEQDSYEDYSSHKVVDSSQLVITGNSATIPYGTALDLGGCGKGYLADQLATALDAYNVPGYWLSLSGDLVVAGTDHKGKAWTVNIQSAQSKQTTLDYQVKTDGGHFGVATSGTMRRPNQPKLSGHHIIDPRSLRPAKTDLQLVTVVSATALQADVLASCAVILGSKRAPGFLQKNGVQSSLLQTNDTILSFGPHIQPSQQLEQQHA